VSADAIDVAARAAIARLVSLRQPDGHFEGFSDAGVAFDAANLVLSRFVAEAWPEPSARVAEKLRHLLAGQHACGLFRIYPGGPCSLEATRIVRLAIDAAVAANGHDFSPELIARLDEAKRRAEAALESTSCTTFDIPYLAAFRLMLIAFDENAPDRARTLPHPSLLVFAPAMAVRMAPRPTWKRSDRIVFPFIGVLPELVGLSAWRAVQTTKLGQWLTRISKALPKAVRRMFQRPLFRAARWLLAHQDTTGGFYYSVTYTFLFIAALRDAAAGPAFDDVEGEAVSRALAYVRARETVVPSGIASSFLASDVWDTVAVATAMLEAPPELLPSDLCPARLGASVLAHQSATGGFSYGRGSKYPDCDSTGLALGLFSVLLRDRAPPDPQAMRQALVRAFDFLELHKSKRGGFNAWTVRRGAEAPDVPHELGAVVFDTASADVTARLMSSFRRLMDLVAVDAETKRQFGSKRLRRLERMHQRGLDYLLSTRDPSTGMWPARWTLGFIIGTRFVFDALETYPPMADRIGALRNDVAKTLVRCQNEDGGFGESQDSDLQCRFTPSRASAALVTAAAYGLLRDATARGAPAAASRALAYMLRSQDELGGWPEVSLCTQFPGLYASYELMTLVALTTTLLRARRSPGA
jgi:hypothetical protein